MSGPDYISALRQALPPQLREWPIWLHWRSVPDTKRGKPKKVPYYADGKTRGKTDTPDDRARLVVFEDAAQAFRPDRSTGLGAALGDVSGADARVAGIDFDNVITAGALDPRVDQVIKSVDTYAEISVSGTGAHIIGLGRTGTTKEDGNGLEVYDHGRYFTFSGKLLTTSALANIEKAADYARSLFLAKVTQLARSPLVEEPARRPILEHSRNNALFAFACGLRGRNVPEDEARVALLNENCRCVPPLDDAELDQILKGAWKYPAGFPLTDLGNAERFVARHGNNVRKIAGAGWGAWDEHRWNLAQAEGRVMQKMADTVRSMYGEAAEVDDDARRKNLIAHARASESRKSLVAAVALAEWQPGVPDRLEDYDTNPLLIGLANGVYDLGRDEFREGRREDRILLQMAPLYDPAATAPRWEQFQREIHDDDAELVAFKQRAWGYSLSGSTKEQVLFFLHGDGSNGKSTELAIGLELFGGYGRKVEPATLLARDARSSTNDIARLRGARLVATVEVEDGARMAESIVKQMTGGDKLSARFLYEEHFEFQPACKIWLAANHKPEVVGTDYAIWRRILLVPYPVRFEGEEKDPDLGVKLRAELPGILNWMLAGYREWRRIGLAAPAVVLEATAEYREQQDRVGLFLRECCKHGPGVAGRTKSSALYAAYRDWTKDSGMYPMSARKFHDKLERDHNLSRANSDDGAKTVYLGVVLITSAYGGRDGI